MFLQNEAFDAQLDAHTKVILRSISNHFQGQSGAQFGGQFGGQFQGYVDARVRSHMSIILEVHTSVQIRSRLTKSQGTLGPQNAIS